MNKIITKLILITLIQISVHSKDYLPLLTQGKINQGNATVPVSFGSFKSSSEYSFSIQSSTGDIDFLINIKRYYELESCYAFRSEKPKFFSSYKCEGWFTNWGKLSCSDCYSDYTSVCFEDEEYQTNVCPNIIKHAWYCYGFYSQGKSSIGCTAKCKGYRFDVSYTGSMEGKFSSFSNPLDYAGDGMVYLKAEYVDQSLEIVLREGLKKTSLNPPNGYNKEKEGAIKSDRPKQSIIEAAYRSTVVRVGTVFEKFDIDTKLLSKPLQYSLYDCSSYSTTSYVPSTQLGYSIKSEKLFYNDSEVESTIIPTISGGNSKLRDIAQKKECSPRIGIVENSDEIFSFTFAIFTEALTKVLSTNASCSRSNNIVSISSNHTENCTFNGTWKVTPFSVTTLDSLIIQCSGVFVKCESKQEQTEIIEPTKQTDSEQVGDTDIDISAAISIGGKVTIGVSSVIVIIVICYVICLILKWRGKSRVVRFGYPERVEDDSPTERQNITELSQINKSRS